jgi:hypothetical protein
MDSLNAVASMWPTPNAQNMNDGERPETWLARQEALKAKGYNGNGAGVPLAIASQLWPTPRTKAAGESDDTKGGADLHTQARLWATPIAHDSGGGRGANNLFADHHYRPHDLVDQIKSWPTPTVGDSKASGHRQDERTPTSHEGTTLSDAIQKMWATPTSRDWKDRANPSEKAPTNGLLGRQAPRSGIGGPESLWGTPTSHPRTHSPRPVHHGVQLANQLERWPTPRACSGERSSGMNRTELVRASLPGQATPTDGANTSHERRTLNPLFVEALMNWPRGWSTPSPLAWTDYESWATASFRLLRRTLSSSSPGG